MEVQRENLDEKAQALLEEKEADARMRSYDGPMAKVIVVLLCLWAAFQVYFTTLGAISAVDLRAIHCIFLLLFTFLLLPTYKKEKRRRRLPPLWDSLCILLSSGCFLYLIFNYDRIAMTGGRISDFETVIAGVALLMVFEAARRASGNLALLALLFLAYNWFGAYLPGYLGHNGFTLRRVLITQFWGTQGVLGTGIGVSATYIFLFVLFGSYLKYSGFSKFINDFSLTLVGQTPGGPAKVAVLASALMGMINGSAVANVATTGTITIPLMKRTGYKKDFAAAVEAVASTGGQFCPPIMGAVGFVMAEFLGLSYTLVMLAAIVPALLYYFGLLLAVHFEAMRLGLSGLSKENIPQAMEVVKKQGHLVIPLVMLIGLMFAGYTPLYAAVFSIFGTFAASWLRKETRMTPPHHFGCYGGGGQGSHLRGRVLRYHRRHHRHCHFDQHGPEHGLFDPLFGGEQQHLSDGPFGDDHVHHLGHGRAGGGCLRHRAGSGGAGAHRCRRATYHQSHVLPHLRLPVQHHAAGGHQRLRGFGHRRLRPDANGAVGHEVRHHRLHHPLLLFG